MSYMLEGLKIIDAASFLAAPGAATIMADYGADVIKVEAPRGDAYRLLHGRYHHDYNWYLTSRNKRDIGLDISKEEGRAVLHRLIDDADVLLINFREDQVKKYGLEYETLKQRNPRLIYAQLTGFGTVGPDKHRRGYDVTGWRRYGSHRSWRLVSNRVPALSYCEAGQPGQHQEDRCRREYRVIRVPDVEHDSRHDNRKGAGELVTHVHQAVQRSDISETVNVSGKRGRERHRCQP